MGVLSGLEALGKLLGRASPIARRLHKATERGARYATHDSLNPSDMAEALYDTIQYHGPMGYTPTLSMEDYVARLERASEQGFSLPGWRALRKFPNLGEVDKSFHNAGAHVDLTPSAHASRIYGARSKPFDMSPDITGIRSSVLDPLPSHFTENDISPGLMSQVVLKPHKNTLLLTDAEANSPNVLSDILDAGMPRDLYYDGGKEAWDYMLQFLKDEDIGLLYPNVGELLYSIRNPSRYNRVHNASYKIDSKLPITMGSKERFRLGKEFMEDPFSMRLLGNPSYVTPDPRNMRDLNLGTFTNPNGRTIYDKEGGLVALNKDYRP